MEATNTEVLLEVERDFVKFGDFQLDFRGSIESYSKGNVREVFHGPCRFWFKFVAQKYCAVSGLKMVRRSDLLNLRSNTAAQSIDEEGPQTSSLLTKK